MFFKASFRHNPLTGKSDWYYRLVENHRTALGEVRQHTLLSVGFMSEFTGEQIKQILAALNDLIENRSSLFQLDPSVKKFADKLYELLTSTSKIDSERHWETVDLNSLKNEDIHSLGPEWLSYQALKQLGIEGYLSGKHWSKDEISLAFSHIISRTVYPVSEYKTVRIMKENSAVCELTGCDPESITKDRLYNITKKLLAEHKGLETFLSRKTNTLFDLTDHIVLYDLTNSYFEGVKSKSELARFGRSKEKRNDCPQVVLGLVVNVEGFIKHSAIFPGNMSDCKSLVQVIDELRAATSVSATRAIVVIDAGIATEENLKLIVEKGYDYVCVSRSTESEIKKSPTGTPVTVKDRKGRDICLGKVQVERDSAYFMKVTSPTKRLKEQSMKTLMEQRFEEGLKRIASGLTKKSGVKEYGKVCERLGRLKAKYPSVNRTYKIELEKMSPDPDKKDKKGRKVKNKKDLCSGIKWAKITDVETKKTSECGVYYLRTNLKDYEEKLIWTIYNCIRNIESTFRTLKTDLNLRPIHHQTDLATKAHIHLGLLSYWIVNTVRHQLKSHEINHEWTEITRIMSTQKCVTTKVQNVRQEWICIRKCSEPTEGAKAIYDALKYKYAPFIRKKSVVPKMNLKKTKNAVV